MDNPCEVNVPKCDILLSELYRTLICYQSNEVSVTEVRKQVTNRCILNTLTGKLVYVFKPWSVSCGDTLQIFLIIKPTRFTNFSNLFLEWNSTCFGQFLCPSSGVFHCTHSSGICHTGLLTDCEQEQDWTSSIYHCCVYSENLMMDRGTIRNM
jgi:hypothetical protein